MKRFEIFFGLLKIPTDFLMTVLAFVVAYKLRLITEPINGISKAIDFSVLPTLPQYLIFSIKAALALIVIFAFGEMYSLKTTAKFSKEVRQNILLCIIWATAIITYFFFARIFPFSRLAMAYSWALALLFTILGRAIIRLIQKGFLHIGIGQRRLVFIGNNTVTQEIGLELDKNASYKILGLIGDKTPEGPIKHLGNLSDLETILKKIKIDEIIQTKSDANEAQDQNILEFCELNQINYRFIPDLLDVRRTNVEIETIGSIPIINLKPTPLDGWGKVGKRILDIVGATLGLIILSPIFLLTAIAIKLDSKGPIFFSKLEDGSPARRVGQKEKLFTCYKFRSMFNNTHHLRKNLENKNLRKDGPLMKIANDPRVTHIGKFIRRYSIDELPQLWNVLIGNMSLVGPRPHLPEEVAKYQKQHHFVFNIKPGLTGLAQVNGRSDLNFDAEAKLDRFYIENWSILGDLKIILGTLGVIAKGYKE
ncbi:sugar transferase [Candidatus Peregrinibacteria bacterium]|nr:sugar transferase [Candidatus Peregrinibacteria bacterium]